MQTPHDRGIVLPFRARPAVASEPAPRPAHRRHTPPISLLRARGVGGPGPATPPPAEYRLITCRLTAPRPPAADRPRPRLRVIEGFAPTR